MTNIQPKLAGLWQVTVRLFDNSTAELYYNQYDMNTRRIIPHFLGTVEQPAKSPFMPSELLVMAAMEWLAQDLGEDPAVL